MMGGGQIVKCPNCGRPLIFGQDCVCANDTRNDGYCCDKCRREERE